MNVKYLPGLNRSIKFVPRDSLRSRHKHYRLNPYGLDPLLALKLPSPPANVDWSKQNTLSFPIDGNDQYGDCFMACIAHNSNAMTGNVGQEDYFDPQALIKDYLKLSGGDNGLSPDQIYPYWKNGILGGPHKILDVLQVDTGNPAAMKLALWAFGGVDFTLAVPDAWLADIKAGMLWDAGSGVKANPNNGHATYLTGIVNGIYQVQTWGLNPPVQLTQAGVGVCDSEAFCVFSMDWFDANGVAPNGLHYSDAATLWHQIGGQQMPPWSGPTPTPTPTPPPVPVPTPTPTPPPVPVPAPNGLQQVIDNLFDQLEMQLQSRPWLLDIVTFLQQEIDSFLVRQGVLGDSSAARSRSGFNPVVLKKLADRILGILQIVCVGNEAVEGLLTALRAAIDALLPG